MKERFVCGERSYRQELPSFSFKLHQHLHKLVHCAQFIPVSYLMLIGPCIIAIVDE